MKNLTDKLKSMFGDDVIISELASKEEREKLISEMIAKLPDCRSEKGSAKYGHSFIPITIEHTNKKDFSNYERVKQLLCQDCMKIFDIEEIAEAHYSEKNGAQQ